MPTLITDSAAVRGGPAWLVERREEAWVTFEALGLPDASDEVWRYSPIGDLDLDRYAVVGAGRAASVPALDEGALAVFHLAGGRLLDGAALPPGLSVTSIDDHPEGPELLGARAAESHDAIVALNAARLPDALVIDVERGIELDGPIVLVHHALEGASFPRTIVRLADGAAASVVELSVGGGEGTLSVPVTELTVGDGAVLRYGAIQLLAEGSWHLATVKAEVGRDGTVSQLTAGLGATYDRMRTDVLLAGQGSSSVLCSTYLGHGDQIHDLRTLQDHAAPRTISDLLCKGAVDDSSRSIYTGVIKVRHGAVRSDARQSNHNLVLSPDAHADSVPNLDIAENDVRCSHASTVGPLDEDQRYYLESRGIEPAVAERLLVHGFFRDLLDRTSLPTAATFVRAELEARLGGAPS